MRPVLAVSCAALLTALVPGNAVGQGWNGRDDFRRAPLLGELEHRWQGAWVLRDANGAGAAEAWNVRGDAITVYDAGRRRSEIERFSIVSPCRVARTRTLPDGTSVTSYATFVFASDGLHIAPAPASGGIRRGRLVMACLPDYFYTYDPITQQCTQWDANLTGPAAKARAECSLMTFDGTTSLVVRPLESGNAFRLDLYGDALLSSALLAHVAEHWTRYDDAVRDLQRDGHAP